MKRRTRILTFLSLFLVLTTLLQGCSLGKDFEKAVDQFASALADEVNQQEASRNDTESTRPTVQPGTHTPYTEFERLDTAYLPEVSFDELVYARPDAEGLIQKINELEALVTPDADIEELIEIDKALAEESCLFATMGQYAYIRYTLDLNDSYYDEEYNWCDQQAPLLEQAWETCYTAMADSPMRDELEKRYYGEGFFVYYDENEIYSNDRVVELMQEESALQSEYMALQSDRTVEWKGEEVLVDDLLNDPTLDYVEYLEAYELYYNKYNPLATDIFVELIRVRKEIAEELEYDSYADFAYEFYYSRDYTPEQVAQYTDDIANELSHLYSGFAYNSYSADMEISETEALLEDLAYALSGEFATAYEYMRAYDLCDFSESTSKMPGSYMTYLPMYGMPFMYVSPTGTISDLLTATHEFGHFVDGYVNCNYTESIDCAEIFSQGLEFLALDVADLSKVQRRRLTQSKIGDSLMTFLSQASYAEFEQRAYELPDEELTAENLNALFVECSEKFGMSMYGMEDILGPAWIDIQHFFIAPMYVISYCVSNDVALQIYQIELENGGGMEAYRDLLYCAPENTLLALLDDADMTSPFEAGRMAELADFFYEYAE